MRPAALALLALLLLPVNAGGNGVVMFMSMVDSGTDPATWSNVTVLLDSDVGVTIGAGGVSGWTNVGAANDFTQAVETKRPASTARGVEADGIDDLLTLTTDVLSDVISASAYTLVAVVNPWAVDGILTPYWNTDPAIGDSSGFWVLGFRTTDKVVMGHNDGGNKEVEADLTIADDDFIVAAYYDGSNIHVQVNGGPWQESAVAGSVNNITNAVQLFYVARYSTMAIKDLVVTSDAKSESDIADVVAFLNNKRSVY